MSIATFYLVDFLTLFQGRQCLWLQFCFQLHYLVEFLTFFQGSQCLWLHFCFHMLQVPSEKESTLKGKNLLPLGANSFLLEYHQGVRIFPFEVDLIFRRELKQFWKKVASLESASIPLKDKFTKSTDIEFWLIFFPSAIGLQEKKSRIQCVIC